MSRDRDLPRAITVALAAWLCLGWAGAAFAQRLDLNIYHIDVGQGDATLIVGPSGRTLLIDGGNTGRGRDRVLPLLDSLSIDQLDYVIASHYDADHIGGIDEVIDGIEGVSEAVFDRGDPPVPPTTVAYRDYVAAAGRKRKTITPGTNLDLGPGIEARCVAVNGKVAGRRSRPSGKLDENGCSVALLIRHGKFDYFTGGDLTGGGRSGARITADVESIVTRAVGNVDVLRLSHHGSTTSSNATFLNGLRPEVAVISVGTGGVNLTYRHPSRDVLDRLHAVAGLETVFQTNRGNTRGGLRRRDRELVEVVDGTIVVSTDGSAYVINGHTRAVDEE